MYIKKTLQSWVRAGTKTLISYSGRWESYKGSIKENGSDHRITPIQTRKMVLVWKKLRRTGDYDHLAPFGLRKKTQGMRRDDFFGQSGWNLKCEGWGNMTPKSRRGHTFPTVCDYKKKSTGSKTTHHTWPSINQSTMMPSTQGRPRIQRCNTPFDGIRSTSCSTTQEHKYPRPMIPG